jgi:hypothetical protein
MSLPKGAAYRLPAGSHIVAEIYYQGSAERVVEHGTLGLYFADASARDFVSDLQVDGKAKLAADTSVIALRPEIRNGVKSIEVSARKPDGSTEVLLFAKDIPLDWPTPYILKAPVALPRGTVLSATAHTDRAQGIRVTMSTLTTRRQVPESPRR